MSVSIMKLLIAIAAFYPFYPSKIYASDAANNSNFTIECDGNQYYCSARNYSIICIIYERMNGMRKPSNDEMNKW